MATTESNAANKASQIQPGYSIDPSSVSRSRPWTAGASGSGAILDDPFFPPRDNDRKPVWNKPCTSSSPLMGADSWPALSLSSHKSPSLDSSKALSDGSSPMPMPQVAGAPLSSSINASASSDNHNVNSSQRKPFRRNNSTSSNPINADQNHTRSATTQSRNSHRHRNGSSYHPPGDGLHRPNFEHGHQSSRNSNGRGDMHLQHQRGFGMMRAPQMLMGSPSFPASSSSSSTQYMAAPQVGSYGGPMLYPDYALHVFLPHPPPESMTLVGDFAPPPIYFPSFDAMLYNQILTQVEYYFSADNLSKDKHLRGQMNDEGWVPVRIIAGFRRLAELTDNIQTILEALRNSEVVELKGEALRRRGDWDKYLLPHKPSSSGPEAERASLGAQLESMTLSERSRE